MTIEELTEIAEAVSAQRLLVENLGMMNMPTKTDDRIKSDARYMVEMDKLRIVDSRYQAALRMFVSQSSSITPPST